ncbi:MAG: KH domain-containing protein [Candidatus Hydrothermales bacterium]
MKESLVELKDLIEYIVKHLVDEPNAVEVKEISGERAVIYELRVRPTDVGKIIGKGGRTAQALRTLVSAVGAKKGKRALLDIIEPSSGSAI